MERVSVVVPIFNAQESLSRCVESLRRQTLEDVQIVLVNDGSTDASLSVCRDQARQDRRIVVIDKDNGGLSSARNAGLQAAAGECIGFVDADDWVEEDMYESMYRKMATLKADLCMCCHRQDGHRSRLVSLPVAQETIEAEAIRESIVRNVIAGALDRRRYFPLFVWMCLYRRDVIMSPRLVFQDERELYREDMAFNLAALGRVRRVCIDREHHYNYTVQEGSLSRRYRPDMVAMCARLSRVIAEIGTANGLLDDEMIREHTIASGVTILVNEVRALKERGVRRVLAAMGAGCRDDVLQRALAGGTPRGVGVSRRTLLFLMKHAIVMPILVYYSLALSLESRGPGGAARAPG